MNRYLFDRAHGIMAIIRSDGSVTFHNEMGFPVKVPVQTMTQEDVVNILRLRGYAEEPI